MFKSLILNCFSSYKKPAFTLAEVLITLGIIGIVAALTIPNLVSSYHKKVVETRLAAFYTQINQAIKLSELDNGGKESWTAVDTNDFFEKYLKNYLKYLRYENRRKSQYGNDWCLVHLLNGSAFLMDLYVMYDADGNQKLKTNGGHFVFCPTSSECESYDRQKLGKSQFMFAFWPAGEISNWHTNKGVEPYLNGWNGKDESLRGGGFGCSEVGSNFFCTAVIQKNGWKIPKNYPFKVK